MLVRCGLADIIVLKHGCSVAQVDIELAKCKHGDTDEVRDFPGKCDANLRELEIPFQYFVQ